MDYALFVQVSALLLNNYADKESFSLLMGYFDPVRHSLIFEREIGVLSPVQEDALNALRTCGLHLSNKSHWLIKEGNKWVGFGKTGIKSLDKEQWLSEQKDALLSDCNEQILKYSQDNSYAY